MPANKCMLVAINASEVSDRAVAYVAQIINGQGDFHVILFHVTTSLPPELLEFGGSENPLEEQRAEGALHEAQEAWLAQVKQAVQPVFDRAEAMLYQAAMAAPAVETRIGIPRPGETLDVTILEAAQRQQCGTIVVGRTNFSWLQELVRSHLADTLLHKGQGYTLWIVQ